jgi:hypothetical protein
MRPRDFRDVDVKHSSELGNEDAVVFFVDVVDRAVEALVLGGGGR